jgi:GT2 family glycosyltransferase
MAMSLGPRPFAVTVNWNRADDTVECVRSLLQGNPGTEVLVVDNGSRDGSVEKLIHAFPGLRVMENQENLGYVKGINQGIRGALGMGATHILVMNNDAIARPGMVAELLEALKRHPQAGIAGPKILYHGSDRLWFAGGHYNHLLGYSKHPYMDQKDGGQVAERTVSYITGCAMLIKAEVLQGIGLFDEDFQIYAEDLEFCLRAWENGNESWYVPTAVAEHKVSMSTGAGGSNAMTPYRAYYYARNMMLVLRKRKKGVALLTGLLGQTFILIPYYLLLMGSQGRSCSFRHYLRGYIQALKGMVGGNG